MNIYGHLERVKGQPHHIRKKVAFGTALLGTALVALVWLAGSLASGAFALTPGSFAEATAGSPVITVDASGARENLAGAAAALPEETSAAHIRIVDTSASLKKAAPEETTIPF